MRQVRALVTVGVTAVVLGSAIIAVMHVVGPGAAISPVRRTISEYMLTSVAWAFDVAVLVIAAGSMAILIAVAAAGDQTRFHDQTRLHDQIAPRDQSRPPDGASRVGLLLGILWVAGLITLVAFPKADWALGPSLSGQIHRYASLMAFLALPAAVVTLLRRRTSRDTPAFGPARAATGLAFASLAWFVPVIVAIVIAGKHGAWWLAVPLGLLERGMAVTEIAALVVLAVWAARTARAPATQVIDEPAAVGLAPSGDLAVTDPAVP